MDLSTEDKLLRSFLDSYPLNRVIIDGFNRSVIDQFPKYVMNTPILFEHAMQGEVTKRKYKCQFTNVRLEAEVQANGDPVWPFMCRRYKKDYVLKQYGNIELYRMNEIEEWEMVSSKKNVAMWDNLNMLGSKLCWLSSIPRDLPKGVKRRFLDVDAAGNPIEFEDRDYSLANVQDFASVDEDPILPLGYFISTGSAKAVTIQEGLMMNVTFRVIDAKLQTPEYPSGGDMVCDIRSMSPVSHEISHIKVVLMNLASSKSKTPSLIGHALYISIPSFKLKATNIINAMRLAYYFSSYKEKNMLQECIREFTDTFQMITSVVALEKHNITTIEDARMMGTDEQLLKHYASLIGIAKFTANDEQITPTEEDIQRMKWDFERYFYPHVATDDLPAKFHLMIDMGIQAIKFKMGIMPASNKDHYGFKRMNDSGNQIYTLNVSYYNMMRDSLRNKPPDLKENDFNTLYRSLTRKFNKITMDIHKNFSKALWGPATSARPQKPGVVQPVVSLTMVSIYDTLRRIGTTMSSKKNKAQKPKQVDPTQFSFVCCQANTEILLADGITTKQIKDITSDDQVLTINPNDLRESPSGIKNLIQLMPEKLYEIVTLGNRSIKATPDHPLLVARSTGMEWVRVSEMKVGDYLLNKNHTTMLSTTGKALLLSPPNDITAKYRRELEEKKLIGMEVPDPIMAILARIVGISWTDGHLHKYNDAYSAYFYLGERPDAAALEADIKRLGFDVSAAKYTTTEHTNKETGKVTKHSYFLLAKGGSFAYLLHLLGVPHGKKGAQPNPLVPQWIKDASPNVKREFLSGFQGGDGGRISMVRNQTGVRKLQCGATQQTCSPEYQKSHKEFMHQLGSLYRELGIETIYTMVMIDGKCVNKLRITNSYCNMYLYSTLIGYRYCGEKTRASALPIEFIRYKYQLIEEKRKLYGKVLELNGTMSQSKIGRQLGIDQRLVSRIINRGTSYNAEYTNFSAINYDEFCTKVFVCEDKIVSPIVSIQEIPVETVYDFETTNENHSFYANSIISHNCVSRTPEGDLGGLVKQLAITAIITSSESDESVLDLMRGMPPEPESYSDVPVYVNGTFHGYTPDGQVLRKRLVDARRNNEISKFTSIVFAPELDSVEVNARLMINTSAGRPVRPLLVVQNRVAKYTTMDTLNFDELLLGGAIEFLDGAEIEWCSIAITPDELTSGREFDYLEIHPVGMFSVASSLMNLANYNTMPRVAYTSNMKTQAIEPTNMAFLNQMETGTKVPRYGQRHLLQTVTSDVIRHNEQTGNKNVVVAILPMGYNVEDALILNEGFLQRGGLASDNYDVMSVEVDTYNGEKLGGEKYPQGITPVRIPGTQSRRTKPVYSEVGEEGLLLGYATHTVTRNASSTQNVPVEYGDVVACKTITNVDGTQGEECATFHGLKGVVDKVWVNNTSKKKTGYRIRIRSTNMGGSEKDIGDKVFAEYSQKGVVGMVLDEVDMPRTAEGITPDVIINTHSFPSRMTMGYILDLIFGLSIVVPNRNAQPIELPVDIVSQPIFEDMLGKTYLQLTASQKARFDSVFSSDAAFGPMIRANVNFAIPDRMPRPIIPGIFGKTYFGLTPSQRKAFDYLFNNDASSAITRNIRSGNDFIITDKEASRSYKSNARTVQDLNPMVRLAYEAINGKLPVPSARLPTMINATPFGDPQEEQFQRAQTILRERGFSDMAKTTMYSGTTGEMLGTYLNNPEKTREKMNKDLSTTSDDEGYDEPVHEEGRTIMGTDFEPAQVTLGMIGYKSLKQVVKEKIRARDIGKSNVLTGQATKGKSVGGGIRYGEMDVHLSFSHGGFSFMQERMFTTTDPSKAVTCKRCYQIAYLDKQGTQYVCAGCDDQTEFVRLCVPRSFDLMLMYARAYGIKTTLALGESENSVDVTRKQLKNAHHTHHTR